MKKVDSDIATRFVFSDAIQHEEPETTIDMRSIARVIWAGRWTVFFVTSCATLLGFLVTLNVEPTYKASAKVMFDPQLREIAAGARVTSVISGEDGIQNEIQVLRSTALLNRVIDELNLSAVPDFNPEIERSWLSTLRSTLHTSFPGYFRPPDENKDSVSEIPDLQRRVIATRVAEGLQLTPIPSSRVIEIGYVSQDRSLSAQVANAFAEQYIDDQLEVRLSTTRAATEWLSSRVDDLRVRVQRAEQAVAAARSAQSDKAGQSLEITRQQLEALIDTFSETESAARTAMADYDRLRNALENEADFGTVSEFRDSAILAGFVTREINLRNQYAILASTLPADHYSVREIENSLENVLKLQKAEAARVVEIARTRWRSLEQQTDRIQSEIRLLDRKVLQEAQDELNIRQLEREADASRRVYETFLERLNAASEQVKLESADARILTLAEPPLTSYSQPRKYAFVVAFIGGILASILLIYLRDRFGNTFRSTEEIENITDTDVFGLTPMLKAKRDPAAVFRDFAMHPKSELAEAVHGVRTSIMLNKGAKTPQVIMFTSSNPGEGKSILAALTALSASRINAKTVLVDCDLRRPQIHRIVGGAPGSPSILSVLTDTISLDEAVGEEPQSGLNVLAGDLLHERSNVSAVDVLSSRNFSQLMETLRSNFDLIIIDAPPTLHAVDSRVLSAHADSIVYVVKWHKTSRDAVLAGIRSFESVGAPVTGVVLSMVKRLKYGGRRIDRHLFADYGKAHG